MGTLHVVHVKEKITQHLAMSNITNYNNYSIKNLMKMIQCNFSGVEYGNYFELKRN